MYEIKKVENEKGKIGKIKDFVKNKLNNLKPKNALKKIAAGGLIAASLFLSRPVMAEDKQDIQKMRASIEVLNVEYHNNTIILEGVAINNSRDKEAHTFYWPVPLELSFKRDIYSFSLSNDKKNVVVVIKDWNTLKLYARVCPAENIIKEVATLYYPPVYYGKLENESWNNINKHIQNIEDALNKSCQNIPFNVDTEDILEVTRILNGNTIFIVKHWGATLFRKEGYVASEYRFIEKDGKFTLKKIDDFYLGKDIKNIDENFASVVFDVESTKCDKKKGIVTNCAKRVTLSLKDDGKIKEDVEDPKEISLIVGFKLYPLSIINNIKFCKHSGETLVETEDITYSIPVSFSIRASFFSKEYSEKYGDIIWALLLDKNHFNKSIAFITHDDKNKLNGILCDGHVLISSLHNMIEAPTYPEDIKNKYAEIYKQIYYLILKTYYTNRIGERCYFLPSNETLNREDISDITSKNRLIYIYNKNGSIHVYKIDEIENILNKIGVFSYDELDGIFE